MEMFHYCMGQKYNPQIFFDFNKVNDWALSPYFTTSDDRLIEYGFRKIIFDECSKYQRVQICSTVDYGNLLILDGAINLAENDTEAYTNALMNLPHVSLDHYSHIEFQFLKRYWVSILMMMIRVCINNN